MVIALSAYWHKWDHLQREYILRYPYLVCNVVMSLLARWRIFIDVQSEVYISLLGSTQTTFFLSQSVCDLDPVPLCTSVASRSIEGIPQLELMLLLGIFSSLNQQRQIKACHLLCWIVTIIILLCIDAFVQKSGLLND